MPDTATQTLEPDLYVAITQHQQAIANKARSLQYCGHGALLVHQVGSRTLSLVPIRCRTWRCSKCGPPLRAKWAHAIAKALPERFITLTCDPALHASRSAALLAMKVALPKLINALRKMDFKVEYCAVWEITREGWPHVHIAQKGTYIPQPVIRKIWTDLRVGSIVDIRAIHTVAGAAKYVAKYMAKTAEAGDVVPDRHRFIQYSRIFFPKVPDEAELPGFIKTRIKYLHQSPAEVLDALRIHMAAMAIKATDRDLWTIEVPNLETDDKVWDELLEHITG